MKIIWKAEVNVPPEREAENVEACAKLNLPRISDKRPPLAIVGGGPSVSKYVEELKNWPGDIWISGSAFPWCLKHGIRGTFFTIDQHPSLINDCRGATKAILATCVDPGVFEELKDAHVQVFDLHHSGPDANHHATSVTSCPMVGLQMGYTDFTFFGCDSSYTDSTHAYYNEPVVMAMMVKCGEHSYLTNPAMLMQAEFLSTVFRLCSAFKVKGDGLLPAMIKHGDYDITHGSVDLAQKIIESQAKDEAANIHRAIQEGQSFTVVYDLICSPPTYGDFLETLMLARYVEKAGAKVNFIVVDGQYRSDWVALNESERGRLLDEYRLIAETLLDSPMQVIPWDAVKLEGFVPFGNFVKVRDYFYNQSLNIINQLCSTRSKEWMDGYLLPALPVRKPEGEYATVACRHNEKWSLDRNLTEGEFIAQYASLKSHHKQVMVVSDEVGCDRFREIAKKHGLSCLFSKDYSDSFIGDAALILNSSHFTMLRGGGIGVIALFSRVPYDMRFTASNELCWADGKFTSWATDDQIYVLSNKLEKEAA